MSINQDLNDLHSERDSLFSRQKEYQQQRPFIHGDERRDKDVQSKSRASRIREINELINNYKDQKNKLINDVKTLRIALKLKKDEFDSLIKRVKSLREKVQYHYREIEDYRSKINGLLFYRGMDDSLFLWNRHAKYGLQRSIEHEKTDIYHLKNNIASINHEINNVKAKMDDIYSSINNIYAVIGER